MKKLIITCMLLTGASMASFAQDNTPSKGPAQPPHATSQINTEQMAHRRANMDAKMYGLTEEQAKSAYDIEMEFQTAMDRYRAEGKTPSQGQLGNIQTRRDEKMKALLNADQYKKYEMMKGKQGTSPMAPTPAVQPAGK